ncbi:PhaM family polyhydroxyalkanoate granule multifunctional regulatory protein [Paraburkholderia flava]|uniref:PhaM family polyhydroxyalkanoate granule multifunctional regulatory protein n=1 Tax=Paraburkholderia flava TaxID=2547393 RepID=UPI00105C801E|nr:PhaM family polyhydroxyalkanoate granule multifunctional regulatory protein [Paraburkholderia flava]
MTDRPGATPPFPGFPGFPPAEMVDRMWDMMRLTPFGTSFPGGQPGAAQSLGPSLSMMSDMMAPLTNVEELDKRITDMRAVEQWLKLNLNMLQSAIQALEVQRATLATLRAFGASFAQPSAGAGASPSPSPWSSPASGSPFAKKDPEPAGASASASASSESSASSKAAESSEGAEGGAQSGQAFDTSGWWNLLQSQFNQLAQFAMTQPGAQGAAASEAPSSSAAKPAAAKRPAAKRAASSKPSGGAKESSEPRTTRGAKKAPPQPE